MGAEHVRRDPEQPRPRVAARDVVPGPPRERAREGLGGEVLGRGPAAGAAGSERSRRSGARRSTRTPPARPSDRAMASASVTSAACHPVRTALPRTSDDGFHRPRLVPARPARARSSAAARRAGRLRARDPGVRARRPPARRPVRERVPVDVPVRLPQGPAHGAAEARREPRGAARHARDRTSEAGLRARCHRGVSSPPTSARSRWPATSASRKRSRRRGSSHVAPPATSSPTSARSSPTPSSRRSGARGRSSRAARCTARPARSPCRRT